MIIRNFPPAKLKVYPEIGYKTSLYPVQPVAKIRARTGRYKLVLSEKAETAMGYQHLQTCLVTRLD